MCSSPCETTARFLVLNFETNLSLSLSLSAFSQGLEWACETKKEALLLLLEERKLLQIAHNIDWRREAEARTQSPPLSVSRRSSSCVGKKGKRSMFLIPHGLPQQIGVNIERWKRNESSRQRRSMSMLYN